MQSADVEYAGFWIRVWASLIDTVLVLVIISPILTWIYGSAYWEGAKLVHGPADVLFSWVLPAAAILIFWHAKQATPGKMAIAAQIVDARTGDKPTTRQFVIRYLGYFVSSIPFLLGLFWVAFDARKQGWHDKLAGTVVIRKKGGNREPVRFNN